MSHTAVLWMLLLLGCKSTAVSSIKLAPLSAEQAQGDFSVLLSAVKNLYGPLAFKQRRYDLNLVVLEAATREALRTATTDAAVFAALNGFLANFHDTSLVLWPQIAAVEALSYDLGLAVRSVEGRAFVTAIDANIQALGAVSVGDELTAIDGQAPQNLLPGILKVRRLSSPGADQQLLNMAVQRPFYLQDWVPSQELVTLTLRQATGQSYILGTSWQRQEARAGFGRRVITTDSSDWPNNFLNRSLQPFIGAAAARGNPYLRAAPYYITPEVRRSFAMQALAAQTPDDSGTWAEPSACFSEMLTVGKHHLLLTQVPSFAPVSGIDHEAQLQAWGALLASQESRVDVLILNLTANLGGSLALVKSAAAYFIKQPTAFVTQHPHVDRSWFYQLRGMRRAIGANAAAQTVAAQLDSAAAAVDQLDAAQTPVTPFGYALTGAAQVQPQPGYRWQKPVLLVTDELTSGAAEVFAYIMQHHQLGKVFGQTTMGQGGSVAFNAVVLPASQASVDIPRGMLSHGPGDRVAVDSDFFENQGVVPDLAHEITAADARSGYVDYVGAIAAAAVAQIQ